MAAKSYLPFISSFRLRRTLGASLRCNIGSRRTCEIDRAVHVKRGQRAAIQPENINKTNSCFKRRPRKISELDRAIHSSCRLKTIGNTDESSRASDLDGAAHLRRTRSTAKVAVLPETKIKIRSSKTDDGIGHETKIDILTHFAKKTLPPSKRYELKKFEQKYRAFVSAADKASAHPLFDDIYHDDLVHMMDGVPMNKAALKSLSADMLDQGTEITVDRFRVVGDRVESVLHLKNRRMNVDCFSRSLLTLKDGRIIRVERVESAKTTRQRTVNATAA